MKKYFPVSKGSRSKEDLLYKQLAIYVKGFADVKGPCVV
jgi:hypothetical protein